MSDVLAYEFEWLPEAKRLLEMRDRFTRQEILAEFQKNPENGAVSIDPPAHLFATPVANHRYTVVWRRDESPNKLIAHVTAVVTAQITGEGGALKNKLERVAQRESKGAVTNLSSE